MLILTRTVDEEIFIGPDIRIMVTSIDEARGEVRLGFTAPRSVTIHRLEIHLLNQARLRAERNPKP